MSYCPIDEAFGHFMTDGLNPNPLESSTYQGMNSNSCQKKKKVKKNRINCNRNNSTFQNEDDIFVESPELTDSDREFDDSLQGYSPYGNIDLCNINNSTPTKNRRSKLSKKSKRTTNINNSHVEPIIEGFQNNTNANVNSNSNSLNVRKKNKSNKKKNVPVNEVFEYQPEETLPVNDLKYIHGMLNNNNNEDTSDSDDMEETPTNLRATTQSNKSSKQNTGMNSQISEINNKINFIMNQISNRDNEITESQHNNIHDIILFVIFGIFVLIILESLYRLISKMVKANTILRVNTNGNVVSAPSVGGLLEPNKVNSGKISSGDTFEAVRNYAMNRQ